MGKWDYQNLAVRGYTVALPLRKKVLCESEKGDAPDGGISRRGYCPGSIAFDIVF